MFSFFFKYRVVPSDLKKITNQSAVMSTVLNLVSASNSQYVNMSSLQVNIYIAGLNSIFIPLSNINNLYTNRFVSTKKDKWCKNQIKISFLSI
jgi:hypothetical protein